MSYLRSNGWVLSKVLPTLVEGSQFTTRRNFSHCSVTDTMCATLIAVEVFMGELKTHRTGDDADELVREIADEGRRADCEALLGLMRRVTGAEPEVWSSSMIGFGTYHYKSASGQEGDWFPVGFASRKAAITVYLGISIEDSAELLARLGKYKPGKGCIYIKRLAEVDLAVLEQIVADSYAGMMRMYGMVE